MPGIVVVDDDAEIVEIIQVAARRLDLQCLATVNPNAFLAAVDDTVSLVIVDLRIPQFDGITLLRMLKEKGYNKNIVVMSGLDDRVFETTEALARQHGFNVSGRLKKPFLPEQLERVLKTHSHVRPEKFASAIAPQISMNELTSAISRESFEVHFQPQVEIDSGLVLGVEALVRLRDSAEQLIFPDRFIPLAEANGLIDKIGWLVARKSFLAIPQIANALGAAPTMSVNVSVQSLSDLTLPDKFLELARSCEVDTNRVTLEITESGKIPNVMHLMEILTRLRVNEFGLSIDDFGTGFAMMEQLQTVPATEIKVDRQFVQQIEDSDSSRAIVQKTIELGHQLQLLVVAEGVENSKQFDFLRDNHCDIVQGYLFSKPISLPHLIDWIKSRRN